jgi:hypothetical protein
VKSPLLIGTVVLCVIPATASAAQDPASTACADSSAREDFVWHSGFWLNLHNFLHQQAKQRQGINNDARAAMVPAFQDTAGIRRLTRAERDAWDRAIAFYLTNPLTRGLADSVVQRSNEVLSAAADGGDLGTVAIDPDLRLVLLLAAPVYRAVWWPVHDRRNRAWIDSARTLLADRQACMARFLASALDAPWPHRPTVVDVSVHATWFGAYSTQNPLHITLSSTARGTQGTLGTETLLHEASHAMSGPLDSALAATAAREQRALPADIGHLVLFYTAGATVQRFYPAHVPYATAFEIWTQNATARRYHATLAREWQPYLDRRRTFGEAITAIVRTFPRTVTRAAATPADR